MHKMTRMFFTGIVSTLGIQVFAAQTITDDFDSGLDKWDKPSSSAVKIADGELTNQTKYAVRVAFKEKNIGSFTLSYKLKLLKKTSAENGHTSIEIDRDNGKWKLYLMPSADKAKILSMYYKNGEKKALHRKEFSIVLPAGKSLDVKIICNKDEYKLAIGKDNFLLGKAPGKGGFSLGSYRQPFAIDDLKIVYDKPSES